MLSQKDIKILLWIGYAFGYCVAVGAPILIDPILTTHAVYVYPPRQYPYAILCLPIYLTLLSAEGLLLNSSSKISVLYISVCLFAVSIVCSFPIFRPEFP